MYILLCRLGYVICTSSISIPLSMYSHTQSKAEVESTIDLYFSDIADLNSWLHTVQSKFQYRVQIELKRLGCFRYFKSILIKMYFFKRVE